MKILLIDNYDSFTYNLVHLFAQFQNVEVDVVRNDNIPFVLLDKNVYSGVIIGPGPGSPTDIDYFGQNMKVIQNYGAKGLPILGICLGFQGIASFFGASLKPAVYPQHGKTSAIDITNKSKILGGITQGDAVMRYHSLMIDTDKAIPNEIIVTAEVAKNAETVKINGPEIMALEHRDYPIYGLQFHPESFATEKGKVIAGNFITLLKELHK